ncbi:hypothetical protein C922_02900 [Plasmodium inui San Antonio 1]|uniref:HIT-type domain-containing protein n=1 Tax=Plasmodium inui San Antonio 1 TaxID=1237626 RepID=W7ABY4_9APIC|nr:hypothetical protein C922_02900 [Plasmodium inui San Antonio 1]EUD66579.1 hypothetical protein C922_02900 [Plasmodium inui San Antonio 1]
MNPPEDYVNQENGNFAIRTNEHHYGSDGGAATQRRAEGYSSGLFPTAGRMIDEAAIPFDGTHTEGRRAPPQRPYCEVNGNASNHMNISRGSNFPSHAYPSNRFGRSRYRVTRGGRSNGRFFFANKTLYVAAPRGRESPHQGETAAVQRDASCFINHSQQGNVRKGQKRKWTQVAPGWVPTEEEASTSDNDCIKGEQQEGEEAGEAAEVGETEEETDAEADVEAGKPLSQFTHAKKPRRKSYHEIKCNILKDAAEYFKNCRGARTAASSEEEKEEEGENGKDGGDGKDGEDREGVVPNHPQAPPGAPPLSANLCCVCQINQHKYKCPFCEALSCSLTCAKEHKKLKKCKNKLKKKLKINKVAKQNLDENMLHRDYIFLHGVESILHGNYRFLRIKENETTNIWLYSYSKLTSVLKKRRIFLFKAPLYTKLHQGNKTTIRHDSIFWMVKVTLVNDCLFVTHQDVSEDTPLLQLLSMSLEKVEKRRKPLRVNYLDNVNAIRVSLNSVDINKGTKKEDAFFSVPLTVREVLRGQAFYEYPHLSFEVLFRDGSPVENPAYEAAMRRQQKDHVVAEEGQANQQTNHVVAEGKTIEDINEAAEEGQTNHVVAEEGKTNQPVDEEDSSSQADASTAPICDKETKEQTHVGEEATAPLREDEDASPRGDPS